MFKVECPGCKAPYQVDERRIPSSGLKMRCPKCGTSFKVDPPADGRRTGPAAVLGGALGPGAEGDSAPPPALFGAAAAPSKFDLRGTIVGVAPTAAAGLPPRPSPPAHLKGTMLGVAPAAAGAAPPPSPARPAPNLKGTMLGVAPAPATPAVAPALPGPGKPPPMPPRRAAPLPELPEPDSLFDEADLPSPIAPAAPAAASSAVAAARVAPSAPAFGADADLPSARAPRAFDDLPMRSAPRGLERAAPALAVDPFPSVPAAAPSSSAPFDDLPLPLAPVPLTDLPSAAALPRPGAASFSLDLDLELPSPVPVRGLAPSQRSPESSIELDLPVIGTSGAPNVGLPSLGSRRPSAATTRSSGSLPSSAVGREDLGLEDFGELGLPAPATAGLPAPATAGLPAPASAGLPQVGRPSQAARVELPSLSGRRASSPGFELDDGLPLVSGNLPALSRAGLPERAQGGLPTLSGSLPAYSSSGLPAPHSGGLPSPTASGLPALRGGISSAPPAAPREVERMPSLPPDFGLDPIPGGSSAPRGGGRGASRPDFGDLDLSLGGPASVPSVLTSGAADLGMVGEEADLFGGTAPGPSSNHPTRERALPDAVVRQSGGGTAYGEVNLGDEGTEAEMPLESAADTGARRDEDMEFGAIPQADAVRPSASLAVAAGAPSPRAVGRAVARVQKPKRKLGLRLYGGVVLLLLGGAALALVPSVGPFGAYVIIDHLKAGEYAALIASSVASARRDLSRDTYPSAKRAIATVESARASAKRVRELAAYAAFTAYAEELRFGSDPAIHARATVLLDELAEHADTQYVPIARCARAAAEGQIARAKQLYDALPKGTASDPDLAMLRGEIALRASDPKAAVAVWQAAVSAQTNPRSGFGLARSSFAAGDSPDAMKAARSVLAQNPEHVGARILLARISGAGRSGEAEALRLLRSITSNPAPASPDELVSAQTSLGDIHLARSRMSQAEAAYNEALKINPKAARALNGLGDALYRAGRFSEAQARFEASTQADPDDISAKIGVAKSKLALERVEDASATLKKLHDTYPQSAPVAYWYGRALEASGSRAAAESVYRAAIKSTSTDSQIVDVYIALALLQSQQGQSDEAQKTLAAARAKLPDQPAIHKALGDVALSQGRYAQATSEFRQALALDAEDLGSRFRLGVALRRDAKIDEANKTFDEVSAVDKEYPGLALERGLLFEASGRMEEALKEYEGALAKAPNDPDLMLRVGCGKVSAGRAKQAEELLRKVLTDRPNSAETNHCLGRALLLEGTRLAESLRLLERAVELDSNRAEYQLYAGWAANEAGNVPKAEHALAEALRLDQGLADAYWQRGVLRQRQGAARDAITDLKKALELRPTRYEAHAALADAYYDLGKEPLALTEWQLAIQAQPDNGTWRFRYGKLLAANHQVDGAREQLSKALDLSANEDPAPRWAWEAHNLLAHAIGPKQEAVKHWEEFLRLGPRDSPYRAEAKASLEKLGHPWSGD